MKSPRAILCSLASASGASSGPPSRTASTAAGSMPSRRPSLQSLGHALDQEGQVAVRTTSFIRLPWRPTSPSHTVLRPIAANAGAVTGSAAAGPDARMKQLAGLGRALAAGHRGVYERHVRAYPAQPAGQPGGRGDADGAHLDPHRPRRERRQAVGEQHRFHRIGVRQHGDHHPGVPDRVRHRGGRSPRLRPRAARWPRATGPTRSSAARPRPGRGPWPSRRCRSRAPRHLLAQTRHLIIAIVLSHRVARIIVRPPGRLPGGMG